MSWFEKAKTVLIEALDIQDVDDDNKAMDNVVSTAAAPPQSPVSAVVSKTITTTSAAAGLATSAIEGATFYDNPHANEMVTIPPRASDAASTVSVPAPAGNLYAKRQSATSDSVDLLSSPSPTSPPSGCLRNSDSSSLELITAPTTTTASEVEMQMSPDTEPSLPDSIVIIASNETSDNPDGDDEDDDGERQALHMEQDLDHSMHLNDSTKTMKAETHASVAGAGADSDSTQSFEDIQMQLSQHHKSQHNKSGSTDASKTELVDQSYSSTSSDIEIISNPNGDSSTNSTTTRTSPQKFKELKLSSQQQQQQQQQQHQHHHQHGLHATLKATQKGHHREPSEISLLSEDSSQSELDKLVNRISELNQVIEAREQRLLQSERQNAELLERNQQLSAHVEAAKNSADSTEANEAVQRLSALEKKFQSSIRERDALRIQIKSLKDELQNKIPKDELAECNEMIQALQSEGEKLSKEILQQSNIIKKLRAKEKTSDTLLKKNGEQISLLSSESERLKKSLAAKEEMERTQIEAVCRMTNDKRRVDEENAEYRSRIEDLQSKLAALQASFDGIKTDLQQRQRHEQHQMHAENQEYVQQLTDMREKLRLTEHNMVKREQQLREENRDLLRRLEAAESRAECSTQELSVSTTPLIRQIDALQKTLNQRDASWAKEEQQLLQKLEDSQAQLRSLQQLESVQNEKQELLRTRCDLLEEKLANALMQAESAKITLHQQELDANLKDNDYKSQLCSLREQLQQRQDTLDPLTEQCQQLEAELLKVNSFQRPSRRRSSSSELTLEAINASSELSDSSQGPKQLHISPPLSLADESVCNEDALGGIIDWQGDDLDCVSNSGRQQSGGMVQGVHLSFLAGGNTTTLEHLQALLKQRDGELTHLQWELSRLQAERGVLDTEISSLTMEMETLKDKVQLYEVMEKNYADLQHRYDALLQMYGEKVERTEELELDLVELKQAYKIQIDELLAAPPPNLVQRTQRHT